MTPQRRVDPVRRGARFPPPAPHNADHLQSAALPRTPDLPRNGDHPRPRCNHRPQRRPSRPGDASSRAS